jgi:hypothetical protein
VLFPSPEPAPAPAPQTVYLVKHWREESYVSDQHPHTARDRGKAYRFATRELAEGVRQRLPVPAAWAVVEARVDPATHDLLD